MADVEKSLREWQKIETAPKDGTQIMIYDPANGGCNTAAWLDGVWDNAQADRGQYEYPSATHWMPLPAPPSASRSDLPLPPQREGTGWADG